MAPVLFDPTSQKDLSGKTSFNDGSVGTEQLECSSPHHDEIEFKYNSIKFPPHGLSFARKNKTPLEIYPQLDSINPPNDDFSVITQEKNCTSEGHRLNGPAPKRRNAWTPLLVSEKTGSFFQLHGEESIKGKPEVEKFTLKKPQFHDHIWRYAQMYRAKTCMTVDFEEGALYIFGS
ncbi:hypothetical protein SUGI_0474190 [Cryptomeria japonica]|nr:hypothetical protein SUGI_0474190 [Cryptomeria japonica]